MEVTNTLFFTLLLVSLLLHGYAEGSSSATSTSISISSRSIMHMTMMPDNGTNSSSSVSASSTSLSTGTTTVEPTSKSSVTAVSSSSGTAIPDNTTTSTSDSYISGSGTIPSSTMSAVVTTPDNPGSTNPSKQQCTDCNKQRFDAASFIGGIVLCGGLIAIGFFGFKFYQSRKGERYHTL